MSHYLIGRGESRDIFRGIHGPWGAHVAIGTSHVREFLVDSSSGTRPSTYTDNRQVISDKRQVDNEDISNGKRMKVAH